MIRGNMLATSSRWTDVSQGQQLSLSFFAPTTFRFDNHFSLSFNYLGTQNFVLKNHHQFKFTFQRTRVQKSEVDVIFETRLRVQLTQRFHLLSGSVHMSFKKNLTNKSCKPKKLMTPMLQFQAGRPFTPLEQQLAQLPARSITNHQCRL